MHLINAVLLCIVGLFFGMLVFWEIGRRIGVRRLARDSEGAMEGVGTVEGAIFGLLALLVAFTSRLGRLSAKFGVPKKCCSLKSTGCRNDLEKHPHEFLS